MIFDLAKDFSAALAVMPADHPRRYIVALLDEAIRRDIHFIVRHPITLFQCMWNSCWWYDCPEAAKHYEVPEGGWKEATAPWRGSGPRLHGVLERWKEAKDRHMRGFRWLRSLRPPEINLGTVQLGVLRHGGWVVSVAFSPAGRRIVSGSNDKTVRVWDTHRGEELGCFSWHEGDLVSVAFSPDGGRIVGGFDDKTIRIWDAQGGNELLRLCGDEYPVTIVAFSADGRQIVSGFSDGAVQLFDAQNGKERYNLKKHEMGVRSVVFSADGSRIVSASLDGTVRLWDAESGVELRRYHGHDNKVLAVVFSPDGGRIASGSCDGTVRLWEADSGEELRCLCGHEDRLLSASFSRDGSQIVTSSRDQTIRIWDAQSGEGLRCFSSRSYAEPIDYAHFSPHGELVICHWANGYYGVCAVESGYSWDLPVYGGYGGPCVAISPDGSRMAAGAADGTIQVWDAHCNQLCRVECPMALLTSLAFSYSGRWLAAGSEHAVVWLLDTEGHDAPRCFRGHRLSVLSVAVSLEGENIISGSRDFTARIWNARSGEELYCLQHGGGVNSVAFSPDGQQVVTGSSEDETIRVWDAGTGQRREVIEGHGDISAIAAGSQRFPWRALPPLQTTGQVPGSVCASRMAKRSSSAWAAERSLSRSTEMRPGCAKCSLISARPADARLSRRQRVGRFQRRFAPV